MIFGVIAILTGFFGVIIGGFWAQIWRRTNPRADPLVCAISAFAGVPFIFCALTTVETSMLAGYVRFIHHNVLCLLSDLYFLWHVIPVLQLVNYIGHAYGKFGKISFSNLDFLV